MADSCQCMTKPSEMLWSNWPPTNKNKWKEKKIVGFALLKWVLLYHFPVKPSYAIIMVVIIMILDEGGSSKCTV